MISRSGRLMAWLGGADLTILQRVPLERGRFIQMALVLLTTSAIAAISMFFALHDGVKTPLVAAAILALLWGVVILNLDRFLVTSMQATRNRRRLLMIALPRLLLATVISLTVATPLVLRTFASDINHQLAINQAQEAAQLANLQTNSVQARQASQLQSLINADQAVVTAQAQVSTLQQQVQSTQHAQLAALTAWQCQLDGLTCAGATGQAGNGPLAQAKQAEYELALTDYKSASARLKAAQNDLKNAQAKAEVQSQTQPAASLGDLKKQYAALAAQIQRQAAAVSEASSQNTGLLAQLQALSQASSHNITLSAARYIVLALFFLIEILPVAVQFMLNLGPQSAYEAAARLTTDGAIDALVMERDQARQIEERRSQVRLNVETDLREKEEDLGLRANQYVAEHMRGILDDALRQWSDQVRARLSSSSTFVAEPQGEAPSRVRAQANPAYALPDADNL